MGIRLIDANAAADKIMHEVESNSDEGEIGTLATMIVFARALQKEDEFPTIETETVKHGRWVAGVWCSECNRFPVDCSLPISNRELAKCFEHCPHCGAKMDGGAKHDKA